MFITGKLWIHDNSYENAKKAFYQSLDNLQLDYIDLYMIHRPIGDYYGAYRALVELYNEGKIKAIGVSNFYMDRLKDLILHQEIKPAVNQIQLHPFLQRHEELTFMQNENVVLEGYSPFAVGTNHIFENDVLKEIALKHHKSIAQVILRWNIQRGVVVIPKTVNLNRMKENIDIWDFELSEDDMIKIGSLDIQNNSACEDQKRLESLLRAVQLK